MGYVEQKRICRTFELLCLLWWALIKDVNELCSRTAPQLGWRPRRTEDEQSGIRWTLDVGTGVVWSTKVRDGRQYCNIKGCCKDESILLLCGQEVPSLNYGRNKSDIRGKKLSISLNRKIRFKVAGEALQSCHCSNLGSQKWCIKHGWGCPAPRDGLTSPWGLSQPCRFSLKMRFPTRINMKD